MLQCDFIFAPVIFISFNRSLTIFEQSLIAQCCSIVNCAKLLAQTTLIVFNLNCSYYDCDVDEKNGDGDVDDDDDEDDGDKCHVGAYFWIVVFRLPPPPSSGLLVLTQLVMFVIVICMRLFTTTQIVSRQIFLFHRQLHHCCSRSVSVYMFKLYVEFIQDFSVHYERRS